MIRLMAFLCGSLFGLGLIVSDMANPARVIAFLDVTGAWDPSLALVMIGALIPSVIAYRWARARNAPPVCCCATCPAAPRHRSQPGARCGSVRHWLGIGRRMSWPGRRPVGVGSTVRTRVRSCDGCRHAYPWDSAPPPLSEGMTTATGL